MPSMTTHRNNSFRTCWRAAAASALLAISLAGCGSGGFQPMYAASTYGGSLSQKMAAVKVTTIPGRVGQRIRNELVFQATGGGQPAVEQRYQLSIAITERVTSTLVNAQGDSASQIYELDVKFTVSDIATNEVFLTGDSYGRAGFERFTSIFSNVRAREDAENRAARTVAHDIKSRLEAFLSKRV